MRRDIGYLIEELDALDPKVRDSILKAAAAKDIDSEVAARDAVRRILTLPEYQLA